MFCFCDLNFSVIQNDCVIALLLLFFTDSYYCFCDVHSCFGKDFLSMSTSLVEMMTDTQLKRVY